MVRNLMALVVVGVFSVQISMTTGTAQESAQQSEESTISGCLQAGSNEGEFVLVNDEKTTYQATASSIATKPSQRSMAFRPARRVSCCAASGSSTI